MRNHVISFCGTQEHRLLHKTGGIPIIEILSERQKTLQELKEQIAPIHDMAHTDHEFNESLAGINEAERVNLNENLRVLDLRRAETSSLLSRRDLSMLIGNVSPAPQAVPEHPLPSSVSRGDQKPSSVITTLNAVSKDFREGGVMKKVTYGLGAFAGFIGARWVWRKIFGDAENEGALKKVGKWSLSLLAGLAAAIGVSNIYQWWNRKASSPWSFLTSLFSQSKDPSASSGGVSSVVSTALGLPGQTVDAGRDIAQGARKSFDTLIVQPISGASEIASAILDGNPAEALQIVSQKGWSLFFNENGEVVIQDTLLRPITAPFHATWNLLTPKGRSSEDFFIVWGEAGGAYLIAKKTAQLWISGTNPIPLTLKSALSDALRVASGPTQSWIDGLKTLVLSSQKDGMKALSLRFGRQSVLGQKVLGMGNTNYLLNVTSEKDALVLLARYEKLAKEIAIMRKFVDGKSVVNFTIEEIASVEKVMDNCVESVQKYLATQTNIDDLFLQRVQAKIVGFSESGAPLREELAKAFREHTVSQPTIPSAGPAEAPLPASSSTPPRGTSSPTAEVLAKPSTGGGTAVRTRPTTAPLLVPNSAEAKSVIAAQEKLLRLSNKASVVEALSELGDFHPKTAALLNESDSFCSTLAAHLKTADNPLAVLKNLDRAVSTLDDPLIVAKIATTEGRLAKVVSVVDKGGDITSAFSKTAKVLKVLQAAGMVADAFVIYTTVLEMIETKHMIDALDTRGGNPELRSLYMQRYAFHAAQIGVAGTGLVTGGLALAGAGGAVAGPVALATLPVSALLYAGYQGHQWNEAKVRTVKDWSAEYDTPTLIADLRSYETMTEGVGHVWDAGFDNYRWLMMMNPITSAYQTGKALFTNELMNETKQLLSDMKNVNENKIRSVVEQTTMVTVPEQVFGPDGKPRDLTSAEVEWYKTAARQYVEAKVQFIMNRSKSDFTPISSGEDVLELMRGAENYGQLKYSQSMLTSQGQPLPKNWPSGTASMEDAAEQYGQLRQRQMMEGFYSRYLLQSALAEDSSSGANPEFERDIGQYLLQETQSVVIRFMVECQEENFQDWWPDGNAMQALRSYLMEGLTPILRAESNQIVKGTLADIARDTAEKQTEAYRQHPVDALQQRVRDSQVRIKEHFLGRRPKQLWSSMSETLKKKYETSVPVPPAEYYPELSDKDILAETPESAVNIELLLNQTKKGVRVKGRMLYVKNAKGYKLVAIREGVVAENVFGAGVSTIETNRPYALDLGAYHVYRPGETIRPEDRRNPAPRIAVKSMLDGAEAQEWLMTKNKRFSTGKSLLLAGGATLLQGHNNVFVLQKSMFDRGVEFFFDNEAGKWFVGIGAVAPTDTTRWRSALAGRDPSTFRVSGMAWGNSKAYNDVIEQLETANKIGK